MEKMLWEKTLHDPNAIARLSEWSRTAGLGPYDMALHNAAESRGFDVEPPLHLDKRTPEVIAANNRSTVGAPSWHRVAPFISELADLDPLKALEAIQKRFKADPSHKNAVLLQSAMNRITSLPEIDVAHRKAVDHAASLFHAHDAKHSPPATDDIWYTVYEHAGFGGLSRFEDMTPGFGYWRQPDYNSVGMNDLISSLAFGASGDEIGGAVVLFEHANYFGQYRTYIVTPGQTGQVDYVGDDFNDLASSALIIRRFANETSPVSLGGLVPKSAITDIVNATPKVSSAGDPTFSWDMWPTGGSSGDWHPNDINSTFIYINVPLSVHTPWPYPDYYAQARYWIYLYIDGNGQIQGYVAYWGYYVESGIISGGVAAGLRDAIPGTIPQVNGLVSNALGLANAGGPYQYVYYLPGRFQLAGNVSDDVTIVAVKR